VPTLVACGVNDRICSPASHQKMAALMPAARFISIDAADHLPPLEQPAATTVALRTCLDGLKF